MFKNIARTLQHITLSRLAITQPSLPAPIGNALSARQLTFYGRGKGGKVSHKRGNAAQLKRASLKATNIRKHS